MGLLPLPPAVCVFVVLNSICCRTTLGREGIAGSHSCASVAGRQSASWAALTQRNNCLRKEPTQEEWEQSFWLWLALEMSSTIPTGGAFEAPDRCVWSFEKIQTWGVPGCRCFVASACVCCGGLKISGTITEKERVQFHFQSSLVSLHSVNELRFHHCYQRHCLFNYSCSAWSVCHSCPESLFLFFFFFHF